MVLGFALISRKNELAFALHFVFAQHVHNHRGKRDHALASLGLRFPYFQIAAISEAGPACAFAASAAFGHTAKLSALVDIARRIEREGFAAVKASILVRSHSDASPVTLYWPCHGVAPSEKSWL